MYLTILNSLCKKKKRRISEDSGFHEEDDDNGKKNHPSCISTPRQLRHTRPHTSSHSPPHSPSRHPSCISTQRQLRHTPSAFTRFLTLACAATASRLGHYRGYITIHRHRHKIFASLCALVAGIFVIRYYVLFLILFFAHPPIVVPPIVVPDAVDSENLPLVPLYVLSASDERWIRFKPPRGTRAIRVTQSSSIIATYMEYMHPAARRRYGEGTLKCMTGHLYIWDMVARDPLCATRGCLIAEDDAVFVGQVDPRPFLDSYASAAASNSSWEQAYPDFMSFYKHPWEPWSKFNRWRTWWVAHVYGIHAEEPVLYVTFGWGLVAYMLTSRGADALLEPLRGGKYRIDDHIDRYIYDRWNLYWHDVDTFVDRRYPLQHKKQATSTRIKEDEKKGAELNV